MLIFRFLIMSTSFQQAFIGPWSYFMEIFLLKIFYYVPKFYVYFHVAHVNYVLRATNVPCAEMPARSHLWHTQCLFTNLGPLWHRINRQHRRLGRSTEPGGTGRLVEKSKSYEKFCIFYVFDVHPGIPGLIFNSETVSARRLWIGKSPEYIPRLFYMWDKFKDVGYRQ